MSAMSRFSAGRSMLPPENPPSSYRSGKQMPALVLLAGDVGLAGLALGVEGVELLFQPLLAALAGVDRAAKPFLISSKAVRILASHWVISRIFISARAEITLNNRRRAAT